MFYKKSLVLKQYERGFSVLEVLITSAIIGIITAVVVVKYGAFNSTVLLKNQAYEMALAIREAQVYSISTRGGDANFRESYGIHIDLGSPNLVLLFLDDSTSDDGIYDDSDDILVETLMIDSRFEISEVCVNNDADCTKDKVSISFARPDFDARIKTVSADSFNDVSITLSSADSSGFSRKVVVRATGQISVE